MKALFAVVLSVSVLCFPGRSTAEIPAGMTPIFDGDSLAGWHGQAQYDPDKLAALPEVQRSELLSKWDQQLAEHWDVRDGVIVNDGDGPFLVSDGIYEDYELYLEYKTVPLADSGIYLKDTPQVQIWDCQNLEQPKLGSGLGSGGLWNNSPGTAGKDPMFLADRSLGEWNEVFIRQIGAKTSVTLNGVQVVDHATMENYWNRDRPLNRTGHIQLQTHGGQIQWRNLAVRRLPVDVCNDLLRSHESVAFRSIFDGETLEGWIGATDSYNVVDGAIQCRDGMGGTLLTEEEFGNFVARVEFKLPPAGNNGLAIRSPLGVDPAYGAMCELQILDDDAAVYAGLDPRQTHGSAYGMVAAKSGYLRPTGEWNFQQVTVNGSNILVELNGYPILDADLATVSEFLADKSHPGKDRPRGHFGLAGHTDAVAFRNLSIRYLDD